MASTPYTPTPAEKRMFAELQKQQKMQGELRKTIDELTQVVQTSVAAPKWIEDIPGLRVPYIATINIAIAANSTTRVEGTYPVGQDGPFVNTGVALYWRRTSGAYQDMWMPATTYNLKMAQAAMGLGIGGIFNHPGAQDFTVEFSDTGSDRAWQNLAIASALFNEEAGGYYNWPTQYMFDTNSVVRAYVTPLFASATAGVLAILLLGFKIAQGQAYQP